ncbi:hypothetical protein D3Z51_17130 [Clostridiaceae bacterium]|nr:hypothetical protein [Clostridiaceae bacterium]RKI10063.1 hypothetical protein D7V81_16545 [bacterium 1XD21-70]
MLSSKKRPIITIEPSTGAEDLEQVPQIKAELRRIREDFDFVSSRITWEQVANRVKEYQGLDLLKEV